MELHADFSQRVALHWGDADWQPSPTPGVVRRMLDRIGDEVARATTIVRYAPGSRFPAHVHSGGEEFLVIEGTFQDEHGDYPAGSYIRNPPNSRHTPGSDAGCTIFVKLRQFAPDDQTHVRTSINLAGAVTAAGRPGVSITPLFNQPEEHVRVEHWAARSSIPLDTSGGAEILVLDGSFEEEGETFGRFSWLRLPDGSYATVKTGLGGATVWIKSGHLRAVQYGQQPAAARGAA